MTFTLNHCPALVRSGILPLIAEGWAALTAAGLGPDREIPFHDSFSVVWAEAKGQGDLGVADGTPLGFLVYTGDERVGAGWVRLGYVKPLSRRKGIYRAIYEEVKRRLAEEGITKLSSGILLENHDVLAVAEALGRKASFVVYEDSTAPK